MEEFELIVRVTKDGSVNVEGPIANKMVCLGALECAKEAIVGWHRSQRQSQIMIPKPGLPVDLSKIG